jgi:hypothetical protein
MQITVRAIPAPGHEFRRRAGRAWSKSPEIVTVVDSPKPHTLDAKGKIVAFSDEITPAQYAELQADPHISAMPVGGGDPQNLDLRARLQIAEEALASARAELASMQEAREATGRENAKEANRVAAELMAARADIEALQAKLAKRKPKASDAVED